VQPGLNNKKSKSAETNIKKNPCRRRINQTQMGKILNKKIR